MQGLAKGMSFPTWRPAPFSPAQVRDYAEASGDRNPVHTGALAAQAAGLAGPVVHGMLVMAAFEGAMGQWLPGARVTSLSARFMRPVAVGEAVSVEGRVVAMDGGEAGAAGAVLRLAAHDGRGNIVCVGDARVAETV